MTDYAEEQFQDIRDGAQLLCASCPDAYHPKIDDARAEPKAGVDALITAHGGAEWSPENGGAEHARGLPGSL